ncbi:MAG: hypothetical protein N2441_09750 [Rhodocyclaceae bacterium]|nr:hypothetical protein [Rhodocyclaceae bacterium]
MRRVLLVLIVLALALAFLLHASGFWEDTFVRGWGPGWVFFGVIGGGLPLLYYACRRGWWQAWRFALLGAAAGACAALPFAFGPHFFALALVFCLLAGAATGWLFWLAAVWRNEALKRPRAFCLPCGTRYPVARVSLKAAPTQSK